MADPKRSPRVSPHNFLPPPLPLPFCLDWISGVATQGTLTQTDRPAPEFTIVRCCSSLPASIPHPLAGKPERVSMDANRLVQLLFTVDSLQ
jgi:hypothetical protein